MMANNTLSDHLAIANAVAGKWQLLLVSHQDTIFTVVIKSPLFLLSVVPKFRIQIDLKGSKYGMG